MKELLFEISYECNLNCIHCSSVGCEGKLEIKDIPNLDGIDTIRISGGEPTLIENLIDYIKYFKDKRKRIILQTNGQKEINKEILDNIDWVWISVYGYEDTHDSITMVKNSFKKSIKFISKYKEEKYIEIQTPVFGRKQVLEAIDIAKHFGLFIRFSALVNQGRCNIALPREEQIKIVKDLGKSYKGIYNRTKIPCSLSDLSFSCNFDDKLVIKPDKSIFNCASHKHGVKLCKR